MITFTCTCGNTLKFRDTAAGRRAKCRFCESVIRVPETDQATESGESDFLSTVEDAIRPLTLAKLCRKSAMVWLRSWQKHCRKTRKLDMPMGRICCRIWTLSCRANYKQLKFIRIFRPQRGRCLKPTGSGNSTETPEIFGRTFQTQNE